MLKKALKYVVITACLVVAFVAFSSFPAQSQSAEECKAECEAAHEACVEKCAGDEACVADCDTEKEACLEECESSG
jgi:hypothetical protein